MKRKSVFVFLLIVLILAGLTFRLWSPSIMAFVGTNTDLIQGLANLVQIFIWIGVAIMAWIGLLRPNQNRQSKTPLAEQRTDDKPHQISVKNDATLNGDDAIAQGQGATAVGKGGIHIGGNVSGSNIVTGNNNVVNDQKKKK
jgi:hypothetical protein